MKILIASIVILFGVNACSSTGDQTFVDERQDLNLEKPSPLSLENLEWNVVEVDDGEYVYFSLSSEGYKKHARNQEKIQNRLVVLNQIIDEYKYYYEENNNNNKSNED